jgi:hypothetical protein
MLLNERRLLKLLKDVTKMQQKTGKNILKTLLAVISTLAVDLVLAKSKEVLVSCDHSLFLVIIV